MKTARFANKAINDVEYVPVRISVGSPRFALNYKIKIYLDLIAPTRNMLKIEDENVYRRMYVDKLESIGVDVIKKILNNLRRTDKEIVLLCFEDLRIPGNWCHRRMFAEWWESKTGEKVAELEEAATGDVVPKRTSYRQPLLF